MSLLTRKATSANSSAPKPEVNDFVPSGHFYSPVISPREVKEAENRIWPEKPKCIGIDFNETSHERMLNEVFPRYLNDFDYPNEPEKDDSFYIRNPQFSWLDARTLFVILRSVKPRRIIEVGSGYSSLLTADVNNRFFDNKIEFYCIEPFPRDFLLKEVAGIHKVIQKKVQDVPARFFDVLEEGDILFIDSSHVAKTGSDVNFLHFEILPRLRSGVYIHIHDIFLPHDYPKNWILDQHRSWNEQYIVQAMLMYSYGFEVYFSASFAFHNYRYLLQKLLKSEPFGGGSLWLRRT
jgi:hypothetical protein